MPPNKYTNQKERSTLFIATLMITDCTGCFNFAIFVSNIHTYQNVLLYVKTHENLLYRTIQLQIELC